MNHRHLAMAAAGSAIAVVGIRNERVARSTRDEHPFDGIPLDDGEELVLKKWNSTFHRSFDFAIAVSGVAGPEGGTEKAPVGTVWFSIGERGKSKDSGCLQISGDRKEVINKASCCLLFLLHKKLLSSFFPTPIESKANGFSDVLTLNGIVRGNHRIVCWQTPTLTILIGSHIIRCL